MPCPIAACVLTRHDCITTFGERNAGNADRCCMIVGDAYVMPPRSYWQGVNVAKRPKTRLSLVFANEPGIWTS